jgi:uncharacterized protein (DUF2062 family)
LGLFVGIAPIWGFQMVAAAALAHRLRLNKAITLLASNISIPPMVPLILFGSMAVGHWLFTGQALELSPRQMTRAHAIEYFWQWVVGSLAFGMIVAVLGTIATYIIARLVRKERSTPETDSN